MNVAKHIEIIRDLMVQAMNCLEKEQTSNPLSDLFIQVDRQSGEVSILDDNEETLAKEVVFDWVQPDKEEEAFYAEIAPDLKTVAGQLNEKGLFDKIYVVKPFAVSLVNEEFGVMHELLFLDDETLKLDDDIWKEMDKELNDFLKGLLSVPK